MNMSDDRPERAFPHIETGASLHAFDDGFIEDLSKPLILYPARNNTIEAFDQRIRFLWLPVLVFYGFGLYLHPEKLWLSIACVAGLLITCIWARRFYSRSLLPILEMGSDGVLIHSFCIKLFIPWSEIKEVRSYEFFYQYVGIVPVDLSRVLAQGTLGTKYYAWMSALAIPICRILGGFAAPINILESELPLSADDIVEQINIRRQRALEVSSLRTT
ncbi:MAG: hypothetical protein JST01_09890 [Cyanobacteria bacterium SZAS TMP-1]|nr:hypothetical protein [Cyanobacteria bacterium SZAS TMP-1]